MGYMLLIAFAASVLALALVNFLLILTISAGSGMDSSPSDVDSLLLLSEAPNSVWAEQCRSQLFFLT